MKMIFVLSLLYLVNSMMPAQAQQQQQPIMQDIQRIIPALEQQRNQALTNHALAEARASQLAEENAKLKAENEELKKKLPPEPAK